jgi:hypothetical protein
MLGVFRWSLSILSAVRNRVKQSDDSAVGHGRQARWSEPRLAVQNHSTDRLICVNTDRPQNVYSPRLSFCSDERDLQVAMGRQAFIVRIPE